MDPSPFGPPPFDPPPFDPDRTQPDATQRDGTPLQPSGTIRHGRRWRPRFLDEAAFQSLRGHLADIALPLLIAVPAAFAVFFGLGALRFALDDRTLWNSVAHSIVQFWYVLAAFVLVALPPVMVAVRRGWRDAAAFVTDRGYWKAMTLAYLVIPAVAAIVAFIIGHVLLVLIVIVVLIVILVHSGGF